MLDWPEREHYTAEDLIEILRILRDPETGCPWDKASAPCPTDSLFRGRAGCGGSR